MSPSFIWRPVREEDMEKVAALVRTISGGMTSLPDHPEFLVHRIDDSLRAFDRRIRKPGGETYLFVLEESESGRIIGTSGLLSRVGGFDPFYTYRVIRHVQEYKPLRISNELHTLELVRNHKGPTEICSLFLHRDFRRGGLGRLLSLARFCFIKAFPHRFDEHIIAELRGYLDDEGYSPFWEAVGKKFFQKDYYTADVLSGIGEKDFIEALLPEYPIYINLLPYSAQEVIGKVHPHTEPAKRILLKEGFETTDEVDIFDAGPILRAQREQLKAWQATRTGKARVVDKLEAPLRGILTNQALDFRACVADIQLQDDGSIRLESGTAAMMNIGDGQEIQALPLS